VPSLWDHERTVHGQDVREVWFRGEHSDVGGGNKYPKTNKKDEFTTLSNISLRWMVHQCLENDVSISFDRDAVLKYRQLQVLDDKSFEPNRQANDLTSDGRVRTDSASLDQIDVPHELGKTMEKSPLWTLLEFWPSCRPIQTPKGATMTYVYVYSAKHIFLANSGFNHLQAKLFQTTCSIPSRPSLRSQQIRIHSPIRS
jgi:hypothetical protein